MQYSHTDCNANAVGGSNILMLKIIIYRWNNGQAVEFGVTQV